VVLIDYPGFNLRLARHARQAGIPVIYFISPQVWAWKPGRVRAIAANVSRMLVIFPFEEAWYRERGVEATFVGHPLVEILKRSGPRLSRDEAAARFGADPKRRIVGLLPGSRINEARRNLPPILGAARLLAEKNAGLQFLMPVASTLSVAELADLVDLPGVIFTRDDFYEAVNLCDIAIVASGTATMEVGLLEVPMVIVYRLNPFTYAIARRMTKLTTFGMINLVAGSRIVPELIQGACTPARIAEEAGRLLTDRVLHERTRRALRAVRDGLAGEGAFDRAAGIIEETLL
jgi:lipid-A-disaccharide synthase